MNKSNNTKLAPAKKIYCKKKSPVKNIKKPSTRLESIIVNLTSVAQQEKGDVDVTPIKKKMHTVKSKDKMAPVKSWKKKCGNCTYCKRTTADPASSVSICSL